MAILLVIGFLHRTTADAAAQDLLRADPGLSLSPDDLAVVTCDDDETVHVMINYRRGHEERRTFWYRLFELLVFGPRSPTSTESARQDLARRTDRLGIDPAFQDRLRELLVPRCSALFVLAGDDLPVDTLLSLKRLGARILTAELVPDVEVQIVRLTTGTTSPDGPPATTREDGARPATSDHPRRPPPRTRRDRH